MTRIDLDDLPPKIAAQLTAAGVGEEVVLVQGGVIVGRFVAAGAVPAGELEPAVVPEERAKEIFELFRSSVEDDF